MSSQVLGVGSRVNHPSFGDGVIIKVDVAAYQVCYIQFGIKNVGKNYDGWTVTEAIATEESITFTEAEKSLAKVLRAFSDISEIVPLGDKWAGGVMIMRPKDGSLKDKEVPIETFFHKITMVRDRLRVMEQRINASNLNEEDKINLQQYITRIYGSLTTFNVLFHRKEDYFVGEKGD
jgi:hypothetical protein